MIISDVCANQKNYVRFLNVFIGSWRAIAAKRPLVARDCAGHAERGVAVVIFGAEAELYQFPERVELFCYQLASTDYAECVAPIFLLNRGKLFDHGAKRFIPIDANQLSVFSE